MRQRWVSPKDLRLPLPRPHRIRYIHTSSTGDSSCPVPLKSTTKIDEQSNDDSHSMRVLHCDTPRAINVSTEIPNILILALGNYTHPGTRHSLPQLILPELIQELKIPRAQHAGSLVGGGFMDERKGSGWHGWIVEGITNLTDGVRDGNSNSKSLSSNHQNRASISNNRAGEKNGHRPQLPRMGNNTSAYITIAKPRQPMNLSGTALGHLMRSLSRKEPLSPSSPASPPSPTSLSDQSGLKSPLLSLPTLLIIHDTLSLQPLCLSPITTKSNPSTHNGLRSISSSLCKITSSSEPRFARLGMGIGRPNKGGGKGGLGDWVLGDLSEEEKIFWGGEGVTRMSREIKRWARGLAVEQRD